MIINDILRPSNSLITYMEKNLDITKSRYIYQIYSENILPVPWALC